MLVLLVGKRKVIRVVSQFGRHDNFLSVFLSKCASRLRDGRASKDPEDMSSTYAVPEILSITLYREPVCLMK
jgi:hypothetical protein